MQPILDFYIEDVTAVPLPTGLGAAVTVRPVGDGKNGVTCGAAKFFFTVHDAATAQMLLEQWHEFCATNLTRYEHLRFPLVINVGNLMWPADEREARG